MKKVWWIVGILVLIIVIVLVHRGCWKEKVLAEQVEKTTVTVAPANNVETPEEVPEVQDTFPMPDLVSDLSTLVIANNLKNLSLRTWVFVNDEQEFASDVYKSQICSKPKQILIGAKVKVRAIAEDTEGRTIAKGEISFETEDSSLMVSVQSLEKNSLSLKVEKK